MRLLSSSDCWRCMRGVRIGVLAIRARPGVYNRVMCMVSETLYHRDDALLYIANNIMIIWAAPITAGRWHCSL